jgi:hypothetical protein
MAKVQGHMGTDNLVRCPVCGTAFPYAKYGAHEKRYCSLDCKVKAKNDRYWTRRRARNQSSKQTPSSSMSSSSKNQHVSPPDHSKCSRI